MLMNLLNENEEVKKVEMRMRMVMVVDGGMVVVVYGGLWWWKVGFYFKMWKIYGEICLVLF